jgi:hydrogenase expression/formation protein HypC
MCLAIPGRVLNIVGEDPAFRMAQVDFCGVEKTVNLAYTPEVLAGDFILAHVGFAVSRVDPEEAVRMHEMGIACSILEAVHRELKYYPGQRASKVGVRIGEFAGVDSSSLRFCFEAIVMSSEPTPLELELENGQRGDELEIAYMELI